MNTKEKIIEKNKNISPEAINKTLECLYNKILVGIPKVSSPVEDIVADYMSKNNNDIIKASQSMIKYQLAKCTTTGFLTSFGGILAMPITIPADLTSVLYIQMRMVAALAKMADYNLESDQTRTVIYATVAGVSIGSILKQAGIKTTEKITKNLIKKIPGKALSKVTKLFGFRFITKTGTTGIINLTKMVPVVGGLVGGAFDYTETKIVANRAYNLFINGEDFKNDKNVIDIDEINMEDIKE